MSLVFPFRTERGMQQSVSAQLCCACPFAVLAQPCCCNMLASTLMIWDCQLYSTLEYQRTKHVLLKHWQAWSRTSADLQTEHTPRLTAKHRGGVSVMMRSHEIQTSLKSEPFCQADNLSLDNDHDILSSLSGLQHLTRLQSLATCCYNNLVFQKRLDRHAGAVPMRWS